MLMDTPTIARDFKADQAAQGNLGAGSMLPPEPEPEPEIAVGCGDFEEAAPFGGAREGWYYKMGANGLGHCRDSITARVCATGMKGQMRLKTSEGQGQGTESHSPARCTEGAV